MHGSGRGSNVAPCANMGDCRKMLSTDTVCFCIKFKNKQNGMISFMNTHTVKPQREAWAWQRG